MVLVDSPLVLYNLTGFAFSPPELFLTIVGFTGTDGDFLLSPLDVSLTSGDLTTGSMLLTIFL